MWCDIEDVYFECVVWFCVFDVDWVCYYVFVDVDGFYFFFDGDVFFYCWFVEREFMIDKKLFGFFIG